MRALAIELEARAAFDGLFERRTPETRLSSLGAGAVDLDAGARYLAATVEGGWHVPHWPVVHGGRSADDIEATRIAHVRDEYVTPDLYPYLIGLGMVGPALLAHGAEAQQQRWLRPIAAGEEIWCQMFSEPEAGSDLANVATRAQRNGDEWILGGQKTWTSRAMWARWGLCLARTDAEQTKHRGLTMFAVAMDRPGVDVRPLEQMNADEHFSEVFLTDCRVPDDCRIGEAGAGWEVAMTVLAHERSGTSALDPDAGIALAGAAPAWMVDVAALGALSNSVRRDRAMAAHSRDLVTKWTAQRAAADRERGGAGPAGSGAKLRTTASYQERAYLMNRAAGPAGMLDTATGSIETLTAPSMSIRGGTDEIQRNILGERVLGLPREPRLDRDLPWSQSRCGVI